MDDYYDDGIMTGISFLTLIGFKNLNQGANVYTNVNTPKPFSQRLIYISIPGTWNVLDYNKGNKFII